MLPARLGEAGVSLRPAGAEDAPFQRLLYRSLRWEEFAPLPWPDAARIDFIDQQFDFQQRHYAAAFPAAEYYLILSGAEPIGRIYIDRSGRALHLAEIALLPDWRGRGIGAALIEALQQAVRDGQGDSVELQVLATNPARRLYERLGFVQRGGDEEFPPLSVEMYWRPDVNVQGSEGP